MSVPATGDCFYDSMAVLLGFDAQVFLCMLRLWYTSDTYEHQFFQALREIVADSGPIPGERTAARRSEAKPVPATGSDGTWMSRTSSAPPPGTPATAWASTYP